MHYNYKPLFSLFPNELTFIISPIGSVNASPLLKKTIYHRREIRDLHCHCNVDPNNGYVDIPRSWMVVAKQVWFGGGMVNRPLSIRWSVQSLLPCRIGDFFPIPSANLNQVSSKRCTKEATLRTTNSLSLARHSFHCRISSDLVVYLASFAIYVHCIPSYSHHL